MSLNYRAVWINANGPIPIDEDGRSYEIHHIEKIRQAHLAGHADGRLKIWSAGKRGHKLNVDRRGKRHSSKLSEEQVNEIRTRFHTWQGTVPCKSEINTFARLHCAEYGLSIPSVANILRGKSWKEDVKWM